MPTPTTGLAVVVTAPDAGGGLTTLDGSLILLGADPALLRYTIPVPVLGLGRSPGGIGVVGVLGVLGNDPPGGGNGERERKLL